jgi:hypothetical protein
MSYADLVEIGIQFFVFRLCLAHLAVIINICLTKERRENWTKMLMVKFRHTKREIGCHCDNAIIAFVIFTLNVDYET